jgi:hypothetical protein
VDDNEILLWGFRSRRGWGETIRLPDLNIRGWELPTVARVAGDLKMKVVG